MGPAPFEAAVTQLEDGVWAIQIRGELDLATTPELEGPLDEAVGTTGTSILLDLTDCEFIDSTGIAVILRAWQHLDGRSENGGGDRVVLCSDNEQVRRVLEVTGLEKLMSVFASRDEALAALRG